MNLRPQLFQAMVLKNMLPKLKNELYIRRQIGRKYNNLITKKNIWVIPKVNRHKENIFSYYNVLVKKRYKTIKDLKALGVPTKIYYAKALYDYKYFNSSRTKLKNVEFVKKNILSLPMHIYNKNNMNFIYRKIKYFLNQK